MSSSGLKYCCNPGFSGVTTAPSSCSIDSCITQSEKKTMTNKANEVGKIILPNKLILLARSAFFFSHSLLWIGPIFAVIQSGPGRVRVKMAQKWVNTRKLNVKQASIQMSIAYKNVNKTVLAPNHILTFK